MSSENNNETHAENVPIPRNSSAIIARAAAGLNMTVSEYLNKTFGDVLPEEKQPA